MPKDERVPCPDRESGADDAAGEPPQLSLSERLESFEDLRESEVGDTPLTRARHLERSSGLRQLYLKFEGSNPSGTQKDRIAYVQVADAMRRGYDGITVATCGNYGVAISQAATAAGLAAVIFVPQEYHTGRLAEMEGPTVEVRRTEGDYEAAVEVSQKAAASEDLYDANPGGANTSIQLRAYGEIAYEIYDELRDAPAAVAVPVSNGTTLAGIHHGFVSLFRRGKTSRIPRIVAASSFRKNPIIFSFQRGLAHCEDLEPGQIRETSVNEPLINWRSIDGDLALEAIRSSSGWASFVSDKQMLRTARLLREEESLSAQPASTAGLIALLDHHAKVPLPGDRYVAVLTGRKGR